MGSTGKSPSTADTRYCWVLNLDADLELGTRGPYAPSRAVVDAMKPHVATLVSSSSSFIGPNDIVVDEATPKNHARGYVGRAWCPTVRAIRLLENAGAEIESRPANEVLRLVNGRGFAASLGQILPDAIFTRDLEEAVRLIGKTPSRAWRVKRAYGMAGRGQRVINQSSAPLSESDREFLRAAARDGMQIEPNVTIVRELGVHGFIDNAAAAATFGRIVEQRCDARGQWQSTSVAENVDPKTADAIMLEAKRVADALVREKYFGPFGIDAFEYRDGGLQPRSEINARYSMGYPVGMAK